MYAIIYVFRNAPLAKSTAPTHASALHPHKLPNRNTSVEQTHVNFTINGRTTKARRVSLRPDSVELVFIKTCSVVKY